MDVLIGLLVVVILVTFIVRSFREKDRQFSSPGPETGYGFSESDRKAILMSAQSIGRVMTESLEIAEASSKLQTKESRLNVAKSKLAELRRMAKQYPFLSMEGMNNVEVGIQKIELVIAQQKNLETADKLDRGKTQTPEARLQNARKSMPLPAAFKEAAIALRALVRERRKQKQDYTDLLSELHRTAAQENFLGSTLYLEEIQEPGYNVAASIPREIWESLDIPYHEIGYEELDLLNKTDKKWLVETWGDPARHRSARQLHAEVWNGAVARYKTEQGK